MNNDVCYLVIDVVTDLPVGCFDTIKETMSFLCVGRTTLWKMIKNREYKVGGFYVEKIYL